MLYVCSCVSCDHVLVEGEGAELYPAAVWFLHLEHVAPGLDPGGLALTAAPPGEARQRLVVPSQPRV